MFGASLQKNAPGAASSGYHPTFAVDKSAPVSHNAAKYNY
jgi:hypothetical protein